MLLYSFWRLSLNTASYFLPIKKVLTNVIIVFFQTSHKCTNHIRNVICAFINTLKNILMNIVKKFHLVRIVQTFILKLWYNPHGPIGDVEYDFHNKLWTKKNIRFRFFQTIPLHLEKELKVCSCKNVRILNKTLYIYLRNGIYF